MSAAAYLKPITILLVEDNPGDVRLLSEALAETGEEIPGLITEIEDCLKFDYELEVKNHE